MFKQILEKIKEYNRIIIHHHVRPDGDCIGSQMGLKYIIKDNFPEKEVYAVGGDVPPYLNYIARHDIVADELYKEALVIVVDTSKKDRIYDERWSTGAYIIKIDHHDDSDEFGDIQYVNEKCSACSAIITEFYLANKDELISVIHDFLESSGELAYSQIGGNWSLEDIEAAVKSVGVEKVDGVLFDLGVSSYQLDTADRGF